MHAKTNKTKGSQIRYSTEIQENVVSAILSGDLLLEEAMTKHGIMSKKTVVRWLKNHQCKKLRNQISQ
ncbi:hypothetical protein [Sphingobacterium chuzhouense]|uniref:Transposase n=1 Tax=Sphingobacterium chuzhouense TaxID=1742264 RepID=A0ABR7XTL6_9SPHI|nr:hypothetical protein [Sphingobacterium chuzhouense]MBD1422514.1 hypothetical protein [Sphingobacterium chuzhouense]